MIVLESWVLVRFEQYPGTAEAEAPGRVGARLLSPFFFPPFVVSRALRVPTIRCSSSRHRVIAERLAWRKGRSNFKALLLTCSDPMAAKAASAACSLFRSITIVPIAFKRGQELLVPFITSWCPIWKKASRSLCGPFSLNQGR